MKEYMLRRASALFLGLSFLFLVSCDQLEDVFPIGHDKPEKTNVYYGPKTTVGEGFARAWVEMKKDDQPVAIGMELSAEALESINDMPDQMFFLTMPKQAAATSYKTLTIDWNKMGHEPKGVYTFPHFDFHFYMIPKEQIMSIAGGLDEGAYALASKNILPANYSFGPAPMAVPHMGIHWVDITSPEYTPAGFTKTFVYGSHQDKVTFMEPMITRSYLLQLQSDESVKTGIPSLRKFETPGYYPASYTIAYQADQNTYTIALTELTWHSAN